MKLLEDTALHVLLGIVLTYAFAYVIAKTGTRSLADALFAGSLCAIFALYFREVTQQQALHHLSFQQGWSPWGGSDAWGLHKQIETFVPIVTTLIAPRFLRSRQGMDKGRTT